MNAGWAPADAPEQIRADYGLIQASRESRAWESHKHNFGISYKQGHRRGWWDAVQWVLDAQRGWDALDTPIQVTELGKGQASIYYPLFAHDPKVWADCPNDGRVTVGVEGTCDACLYNFSKD